METNKKGAEAQGAEKPKKEKKVQMSISVLKELANDTELLQTYLHIVETVDGIETPMAYNMAKYTLKERRKEGK